MPAHAIDLRDPQNVVRLLLALVLEANGELRMKAVSYDTIDRTRLLTVDYDRSSSEVVLRATSDFGAVIAVQPESAKWTRPIPQQERPETPVEERVHRTIVRSDEELALLEEKRAREAELAREIASGEGPPRLRVRTEGPRQ